MQQTILGWLICDQLFKAGASIADIIIFNDIK
jgi:hypothetical protein